VEVATDYQKAVGAVQNKQAAILEAEAERNRTLSSLAGSVEEADRLYVLAARYQRAEDENNNEEIEKVGRDLDTAFAEAKGEIFSALRSAQSHAFEKATLARATGERFASQLKAYEAGEEIYMSEQILGAFEEGMRDIRKFVVVADQNDRQVFIVNLEGKLVPSLLDMPGFEESSEK
jgi:hypothetical protein